MLHDPSLYLGTAEFYERGRPPYSDALVPTLIAVAQLTSTVRVLDVGCGPGILTTLLAPHVASAVGIDPDGEMLAAAQRRATRAGLRNSRFIRARAEELANLDLGTFALVTFGQSFHWTDCGPVAETVYELLEPLGTLALISHAHAGRPQPPGPGHPPIPHAPIRALIEQYLGANRRAGAGYATLPTERYEDVLARTRFGTARRIYVPGRADIVQDAHGVLANYFSMSFCAPHLFGSRRTAFEADVRALLALTSHSGLFWDWPGDTEIVLARKAG